MPEEPPSQQVQPPRSHHNHRTPPNHRKSNVSRDVVSVAALILGIVGLLSTFVVPFCNLPLPVAGVVFGFLGIKSQIKRKMAYTGLALSALTLIILLFEIVIIFISAIAEG